MEAVALTIAGSDPSGGAGIQADLKTFHQFGVYGEAAITVITVQNTRRLERLHCLEAGLVAGQIRAVIEDIRPHAAKTGALGGVDIVEAVAAEARAFDFPLVVDPVMISKHGSALIADDARQALKTLLLPLAFLLTPNLAEAAVLARMPGVTDLAGMRQAAQRIAALGPRAVLVKGGHLAGDAVDVLYSNGQWREFSAPRIVTRHTHGTGCTYSAAITAELARGTPLGDAIGRAKRFVTEAIRTNPGLGGGNGPLNHRAAW